MFYTSLLGVKKAILMVSMAFLFIAGSFLLAETVHSQTLTNATITYQGISGYIPNGGIITAPSGSDYKVLTWNSRGGTTCTLNGKSTTVNGQMDITKSSVGNYTFACTGMNTFTFTVQTEALVTTVLKTATITYSGLPYNGGAVPNGGTITIPTGKKGVLAWNSNGGTSCTINGAAASVSGDMDLSGANAGTYTFACTGMTAFMFTVQVGTPTTSTTQTVTPVPVTPIQPIQTDTPTPTQTSPSPTIQQLITQVAELTKMLNQLLAERAVTTQSTGSTGTATQGTLCQYAQGITKTLSEGMTDTQVMNLQKFLNRAGTPVATTGVGSLGNETNYYGAGTERAVQLWQTKNGIVSSGSPETTGYGVVGSKTRTAMQAGCGSSTVVPSTTQNTSTSVAPVTQTPVSVTQGTTPVTQSATAEQQCAPLKSLASSGWDAYGSCMASLGASVTPTSTQTPTQESTKVCTGTHPPETSSLNLTSYTDIVAGPSSEVPNTVWKYGVGSCTWTCVYPQIRNGDQGCKAPTAGSGVKVKVVDLSTSNPKTSGIHLSYGTVVLGGGGSSLGNLVTDSNGNTPEIWFPEITPGVMWSRINIEETGYKIKRAEGCIPWVYVHGGRQYNQCKNAKNGDSVTIYIVKGDTSTQPVTWFLKTSYKRGENLSGGIIGGDPFNTYACMSNETVSAVNPCNNGGTLGYRKLGSAGDDWKIVSDNDGDRIVLSSFSTLASPLGKYVAYARTGLHGGSTQTSFMLTE